MIDQRQHIYVYAERTPDKPAVRMAGSDGVVTFAQLEQDSNRIAHLLRGFGVQAGDHIALLMENQLRFLPICWAAQRSGIFYTAASTRLTAGEAAYVFTNCQAKVFITTREMAALAAEVRGQLPRDVVCLMLDGTIDGYASFEAEVARFPATRIADESLGTDMLYSSGTTGRPKGVLRRPETSAID